jgi:uncharacterized membrane protein
VTIEYPRKGLYAIGFVTTKVKFINEGQGERKMVGVFIPATPTPMTGIIIFMPEDEVTCLSMTVEEGLKIIVSGGIVTPEKITMLERKKIGEV